MSRARLTTVSLFLVALTGCAGSVPPAAESPEAAPLLGAAEALELCEGAVQVWLSGQGAARALEDYTAQAPERFGAEWLVTLPYTGPGDPAYPLYCRTEVTDAVPMTPAEYEAFTGHAAELIRVGPTPVS